MNETLILACSFLGVFGLALALYINLTEKKVSHN